MVNRILEKMYFYLQKSKNGNSYSSWYSVFFSQHGLKCIALQYQRRAVKLKKETQGHIMISYSTCVVLQ